MPLSAALVALSLAANVTLDYRSGSGLVMRMDGVPIIEGSWFQYYEPGWTKGYYSSNYQTQNVSRSVDGSMRVTFQSTDRRASGDLLFKPLPRGFAATYTFSWSGDHAVMIENAVGILSAAPWVSGALRLPDNLRKPLGPLPGATQDYSARRLGPPATDWALDSDFGTLEVQSDQTLGMLDGRGLKQDWAEDQDAFWVGHEALKVEPGQTVTARVTFFVNPDNRAIPAEVRATGRLVPAQTAVLADTGPRELIPKPRSVTYDTSRPNIAWNRLKSKQWNRLTLLNRLMSERFDMSQQPKAAKWDLMLTVATNVNLPAEGYRLVIDGRGVTIESKDEAGLKAAQCTLVDLMRAEQGMIVVPRCTIVDEPKVAFRGAHLFVGPQALAFQSKLMDRVLRPLKLNRVVLQCERTDWLSTPGIKTGITMDRLDLQRLFERYRATGMEPIPLIQSFGHMEWLFANNRNKSLALNPDVPYAIDPRKPESRILLEKIWLEAIALLQPKTLHFGLDEVDMRGMDEDDHALVTELWNLHIPWLGSIAKKYKMDMMLWGDQALAPGEAPDAALGDNAAEALKRRQAIPAGAMIADWHYKDDTNPQIFNSLKLWKEAGMKPVASTWFRTGNIYGFIQRAITEQAGVLQTTWAGYESNEDSLLNNFRQYSAFVLAADYAWSGRTEPPVSLPYRPEAVLQRLYFDHHAPLQPIEGTGVVWGKSTLGSAQIGRYVFQLCEPLGLWTPIQPKNPRTGNRISVDVNARADQIAFALDTTGSAKDNTAVAQLEIELVGGGKISRLLNYGVDVRWEGSSAPTYRTPWANGRSALVVSLPVGSKVSKVSFVGLDLSAPVRLHGITTWTNRPETKATTGQ